MTDTATAATSGEATDDPGDVVIIGAGPAGLTAAYELARRDVTSQVFEGDDIVGGISRTVERDGWRFDIGGHRFFTKVKPVEDFWHEILEPDEFLLRPRMSRIFYDGKYYDYPLKAFNALRNLGIIEAVRCVLSYLWVRIRPPKDQSNFEGWVASRFGWRLYRTFFKTYTEKVWGVPATEIQADWAAQRIKNLSLFSAVWNAITPSRNQKDITSLIEEFEYPKYGPGMMWERCTELVEAKGTPVHMQTRVVQVDHADGGLGDDARR
ncbi:MAG: NAD(P)-binding protein, partial [Actinomycetota bacterium]